jgi:hypothetical protein
MKTPNLVIPDSAVIDSALINKYHDAVYTDISALFDLMYETMGELEIMSNCIKLVDAAGRYRISMQNQFQTDNVPDMTIGTDSILIFPDTLDSTMKANIDNRFRIITSSVINKTRLWTTIGGNDKIRIRKPNIIVRKSSNNYIFTNKPQAIHESDITNVLTGELPYLIKFIGEDVRDGSLVIEIVNQTETETINTVEYYPFPSSAMMELRGISVDGERVTGLDHALDWSNSSFFQRTEPCFISFKPVLGSIFQFSMGTGRRIESLNSSIVGLDLIEGYKTSYASESYFGFEFIPDEDLRISSFKFNGTWSNPYRGTTVTTLYSDRSEFDSMSNNFVFKTTGNDPFPIFTFQKNKSYWFLIELQSEMNNPTILSNIEMNFTSEL